MKRAGSQLTLLIMNLGLIAATVTGCAPLTPYPRAIMGLPPTDFLTFQGRKVHVEERGSGPPLLLLHGFAASTYSFHKLIPRLADHFRVVALDYNGFGYTERPTAPNDFGIEAQLALIEHVMDAKKMGRATVLGQSFGGTLALLLAQTNPERVQRLVLVSAVTEFGRPPAWVRNPLTRWAGYPAARLLLSSPKRFRAVFGNAYYQQEVLTPEAAEAYRQPLLIEGLKETYFAFTTGMASGNSPGLAVGAIKAPALVVAGRHDQLVPPAQAERLAKALPDARLLILEQSAHSSPEEEPDALAEAIRNFVPRHPVHAQPAAHGNE